MWTGHDDHKMNFVSCVILFNFKIKVKIFWGLRESYQIAQVEINVSILGSFLFTLMLLITIKLSLQFRRF